MKRSDPNSALVSPVRHSIFWRVAAVMVGVQLTTAVLAAGFTVWYARDQSKDLAAAGLQAKLDAVAEEIERRADMLSFDGVQLGEGLAYDLKYRFPDPIVLTDLDGSIRELIRPGADGFAGIQIDSIAEPRIPDFLAEESAYDVITVRVNDEDVPGGFAFAPLLNDTGFPVGGVLVQPLTASLERELSGTRAAFRRSIRIVMVSAVLLALMLGALFTWWLVRPVRRIASQVEEIGSGRFESRLEIGGRNEFSTLAATINRMAERIHSSIEDLKSVDRVRRELIANVGHDLRTPLAALRAGLEEVRRFESEGRMDDVGALLPRVERQAATVHRLIDDLFELAVLEAGAPVLREEPVPIQEMIRDAVDGVRANAADRDVRINIDVAPGVPLLRADGSRLLRLVSNLLSNAVRHTPEGGSVTVRCSESDGIITLDVVDFGDGVPEQDREHIFERYYRGEGPRTRAHGSGTGLGLPISRAVARAHGGDLFIAATSGSGGTTMRVTLPAPEA